MGGALRDIATKRSDVFHVAPSELQVKAGWNCRNLNDADNKAHVASLKMSIREVGVQEPLSVFREGDTTYVSDGHCRLAAVLELLSEGVEIATVPVKTEGRGASEADAVLRQALDGKPKTAFELGIIFKRLMGYGWTEEQIAAKSGKGIQSVRMSLELQAAPAPVLKMVASGRVAPTLAVQVLAKEGENAAKVLSDAVDTAAQQGKTHATAQHIGSTPTAPRKARLTQVSEIIEKCELVESEDDLSSVDWSNCVAIVMTDSERTNLFRLLDI